MHGAAAELAVAGEGVYFGFLGQFHGGHFGRVVDDQPGSAFLAVSAGVAVDMGAFAGGIATVIHGGAHQGVPQQNGEVVGTGHEGAVL